MEIGMGPAQYGDLNSDLPVCITQDFLHIQSVTGLQTTSLGLWQTCQSWLWKLLISPLNLQVPLAWPFYYLAYNPILNYQHILEKKVVKVCQIWWHNLQIHANFVGMNHQEVNLTLCMRYSECWTRCQKVFEVNGIQDDSFIAFGDRKPASRYHFQVIPKRYIGVWRIMAPDKLSHAAI